MKTFGIFLVIIGFVSFSHQEINEAARTWGSRNLACGATSRAKTLTITNPSTLPKECIYKIQPSSLFVCQLRIDFDIALNLPTLPTEAATSPVKVPTCDKDEFSVDGFKICGVNRNQHIYVPFNITRANFRETLELKFKIADRFADASLSFVGWNLKIQQLDCPNGAARSLPAMNLQPRGGFSNIEAFNPLTARTLFRDGFLLAPNGCRQYFPHSEGTIETFNYNSGRGPYFPNMDYTICFRRRSSDTKITYTFESFGLESVKRTDPGYDANCFAQTAVATASEDYLLIPNGETAEKLRVTRLCGNTINTKTVVANQNGPFWMQFHSDGNYIAKDPTEAGFRIKYKIE